MKKMPDARDFYRLAQRPVAWLRTAERLRDAAELILLNQEPQEVAFFQDVDRAGIEAEAAAASSADRSGIADVLIDAPNYLPAQMLYAFALENALKGLMIEASPELVSDVAISGKVKGHDLIELAKRASFKLMEQEVTVLNALSELAMWAGRYPAATSLKQFERNGHSITMSGDPHSLLDYGSQHPIMRACAHRSIEQLASRVPDDERSRGVVAVVSL